jgi:hypothetical protein
MRHPGVVIAVSVAIASHLTPDDTTVAANPLTDFLIGQACVAPTHDHDTFVETEPMTSSTRPLQISRISQAVSAFALQ